MTPIHKKGSKLDPGNYRPISLTSVPCKIMKKLVRDSLVTHLTTNGLISKCQHGFTTNKACNTNLLESMDFLSKNHANKNSTDLVLLDFQRAFDRVPHKRLMVKLKGYGVIGKLLSWFESFLADRRQRVVLGKSSSSWSLVTSGVPQGSVIGPILFLIYINDLPDCATSKIVMYADDSKIAKCIRPSHHIEDCNALQADLNSVVKWTDAWLMRLHTGKCLVIHCGRNNPHHKYSIRDTSTDTLIPLETSKCERDLGVLISSDLKMTPQCTKAAAKANGKLGLMLRTFVSRDPLLWKSLYITFIRPFLEFAVAVWNPHLARDIKILEKVQARATKVSQELKSLSYHQRCNFLQILTLDVRRTRGDLIQQYKILNNIDNINWTVPQTFMPERPRHRQYLEKELVKNCSERSNFFTVRIVRTWNSLPDSVVNAVSCNSFKAKLDKIPPFSCKNN